jgi:hypothetical protein
MCLEKTRGEYNGRIYIKYIRLLKKIQNSKNKEEHIGKVKHLKVSTETS